MSVIYKSFDSSEFLFENIWKEFPNIISRQDADGSMVINSLLISSKQFCDLQNKKFFSVKNLSQGSFGAVGIIQTNSGEHGALVYSWNPFDSTQEPTYFNVKVVIKIGLNNNVSEITKLSFSTIGLTDPLSDMVFGSMLGHLYDLGVSPFVSKYFGNYICENNTTSMIIERADIELFDMVRANKLTEIELEIILYQYIHSLYTIKKCFGMVHFDSHLRNIMLKDLKSLDNDYLYQGKSLDRVKYFLLETGVKRNGLPVIVALPRIKYLVKIIDYGCMLACLDRSEVKRLQRDLRIQTRQDYFDKIGAGIAIAKARESPSYANTVDLMFTILNVYSLGIKVKNSIAVNVADKVSRNVFGQSIKAYIGTDPKYIIKNDDWFMRVHDCGITLPHYSDLKFLCKGIINGCPTKIEATFGVPGTNFTNQQVLIVTMDKNINLNEVFHSNIYLSTNEFDLDNQYRRFMVNINKFHEDRIQTCDFICEIKKHYPEISKQIVLDEVKIYNEDNFVLLDIEKPYISKPKSYNIGISNSLIANSKPLKVKSKFLKFKRSPKEIKCSMKPFNQSKDYNDLVISVGRRPEDNIPFGFTMIKKSNTFLFKPFSNAYNGRMAVLSSSDGKNMTLETYGDFIERHFTAPEVFVDNRIAEVTQRPIFPLRLKDNYTYEWAITIGPILIEEGKPIFTNDSILDKTPGGGWMFVKENVNSQYGIPGVNDSNELQSHLVLIERKEGISLLLVDGSEFRSPGVDRVDLTTICQNIGANNAVCLTSGLSTNMTIRNSSNETDDSGDTNMISASKSPITLPPSFEIGFKF